MTERGVVSILHGSYERRVFPIFLCTIYMPSILHTILITNTYTHTQTYAVIHIHIHDFPSIIHLFPLRFLLHRCFPSLISRPRSSELCRGRGNLLLQTKRPRNGKEMVKKNSITIASSRDLMTSFSPNQIHRNSIAHFSQEVYFICAHLVIFVAVFLFFPFLYSHYKYVVGVSLLLKLHQMFGQKKMPALFL